MDQSTMSTVTGSAPRAAGRSSVDDVDRSMVAALRRDGRLSVRALAEQVHVSRASAYTRLQRLRSAGVITGFTAVVAPEPLGLLTSAYVAVSIEQNSWRAVAEGIEAVPGVERVALVGAEFDVLVHVRCADNQELRGIVLEQIQAVPGVKATRTWLIFEEREPVTAGEPSSGSGTGQRHTD